MITLPEVLALYASGALHRGWPILCMRNDAWLIVPKDKALWADPPPEDYDVDMLPDEGDDYMVLWEQDLSEHTFKAELLTALGASAKEWWHE